jgi:hypothetical protein
MLKAVRLAAVSVVVILAGLVAGGCTIDLVKSGSQISQDGSSSPIPLASTKASCDKNDIISDQQMQTQDMTQQQIQKFLESWKGFLATYKPDGKKLASQFIFEAAQKYKISPKVILVTLQKERSLVTKKTPTQCDLDWAMGYGAKPKSCGGQATWSFITQVNTATWQFRQYYNKPQNYNFKVGKASQTLDPTNVTPANQATANLYNYTPWAGEKCGGKIGVGGNGLFWQLWYQTFNF